MLSCLLNGRRINCVDGNLTKDQLKSWAKKKILLCPACGKPYEYCHGRVNSPYFRHMDKAECEDKYSEPETEEHIRGKRDLFEWLKRQANVTDCILEGWLPSTKQRPDIMFKYNGEQCVLEYQCSPISSEYYERHELYEHAGIKDFWILGVNKYFTDSAKKKHIQKVASGHYDPFSGVLMLYEYDSFYGCLDNNGNTLLITSYGTYNTGVHLGRNLINYEIRDFAFRDKSFSSLNVINSKRMLRANNFMVTPRARNTYWDMQRQINQKKEHDVELVVKQRLQEMSNENWNFCLRYTKNKYNVFCYICAEPQVKIEPSDYWNYEKEMKRVRRDFFKRIKMWKLDQDKLYLGDRDYLIENLMQIMQYNKQVLLSHHFRSFRVLEKH